MSVYSVEDLKPTGAGSDAPLGSESSLRLPDGTVLTAERYKALVAATEREMREAYQRRRAATLVDAQRRFAANASHELRTPLAVNRTLIDVTLDEADVAPSTATLGRALLAVNARHERLIDAMLTLATSELDVTERTPVDLADIAAYVLAEARPQATAAGVRVRLDPGPAPTDGDPVLLERLVSNLVSNAIRHNHRDGWLILSTGICAGTATLEVINSGSLGTGGPGRRAVRTIPPTGCRAANRRDTRRGWLRPRIVHRAGRHPRAQRRGNPPATSWRRAHRPGRATGTQRLTPRQHAVPFKPDERETGARRRPLPRRRSDPHRGAGRRRRQPQPDSGAAAAGH